MVLGSRMRLSDGSPHVSFEGQFLPLRDGLEFCHPDMDKEGREHKKVEGDVRGELLIYGDGLSVLVLDKRLYHTFFRVENGGSDCDVVGKINNGASVVLLGECKDDWDWRTFFYPGRSVLPAYCLVQDGQFCWGQEKPLFCEFDKGDKVEFDKVRFVLDGMFEFGRKVFESPFKDVLNREMDLGSFRYIDEPHVDMTDWAQHGFMLYHGGDSGEPWGEPSKIEVDVKTWLGDIVFKIECKGRWDSDSRRRDWETYCTLELPKMVSFEDVTKLVYGVKMFFDFMFQSALAVRAVWVYSSKQVIRGVDLRSYPFGACPVRTLDKEIDLSCVNVPVCWRLYFQWPEGLKERSKDSSLLDVKIRYGDFEDRDGKNVLGEYLGGFLDCVVGCGEGDDGEFKRRLEFWLYSTYMTPHLDFWLSVNFSTLGYFVRRMRMGKAGGGQKKKREKDVSKKVLGLGSLVEPLGASYKGFESKLLECARGDVVDVVGYDLCKKFPWMSKEKWEVACRGVVVMRYHFLDFLRPGKKKKGRKLNKKLASILGQCGQVE